MVRAARVRVVDRARARVVRAKNEIMSSKKQKVEVSVIASCEFLRVGFMVASDRAVAMGSATAVRVAIIVASARERPCLPSTLPLPHRIEHCSRAP